MPSRKTRLYVIGDKDFGVVFVTLYPLRAAVVSQEEIEGYVIKSGKDIASTFGEIAAAALGFITGNDDRDHPFDVEEVQTGAASLIQSGTTVSDADFCFVANLKDGWDYTGRIPSPPIKDALTFLQKGSKGYEAKEYPAALVGIDQPKPDGAKGEAAKEKKAKNAAGGTEAPQHAAERSPRRPSGSRSGAR